MKTKEQKMNKQYADRDIENQGKPYATHICAMTAEQLLSKSDIAAELAHRDIEIEALKAEVERQSNVICENVCGDCLEYEDDGTPQTGYGWNENRVEGQYACGCIQESGPYQVIEAERDRLREDFKEMVEGVKYGGWNEYDCQSTAQCALKARNHKEG